MKSLNWIYDNFTAVNNVVVAGSSAGAIGASFYAGLLAEHYPSSPVVVVADGKQVQAISCVDDAAGCGVAPR